MSSNTLDIELDVEVDYDIIEEDISDVNEENYNDLNTISEGASGTVVGPSQEIRGEKYKILTKDTVHQQIFVNSGMLRELGERFNCQINFRRKDGRYALFVRPNDTNYMINVTNGVSKENQDRIFFNLSLKDTTGEPKRPIKTEYMSCYIVDNTSIMHKFKMDGIPTTIVKNKVNLKNIQSFFNPYLKLNELITKYLNPTDVINMNSELTLIIERINRLQSQHLDKDEVELLIKLIKTFENDETKKKFDKSLNEIYLLHKKFLKRSIGNKGPEEIDFKISNKELYKTNNKFTEMLAFRYATYIPDFEFTKSSVNNNVFTDPFLFKLETPFTATDIYLHRFDRHFNDEYAMDRYEINTPNSLHRLAEIVELTKSLMMTFINISYKIMSRDFTSNNIIFQLNNIYQGLIWNKNSIPVYTKYFDVIKTLKDTKLVAVNIKKLDSPLSTPISVSILRAYEIPFIGILPPVEKRTKVNFSHVPVIMESDKRNLNNIDLQGIEKFMIERRIIDDRTMDRIYSDFFDESREAPLEVDVIQGEFVELNKTEYETMFPELTKIEPKIIKEKIPGVVSVKADNNDIEMLESLQASPSTPSPSSSTSSIDILKRQLPYSREISSILIDIRKFKKDGFKPIKGETRTQRGNRLKQFRPMIAKLEELRRKQLEELKVVPAGVQRLTQQLKEEGIVKLSRREQRDKEIVESIEKAKKDLLLERDKLRNYEINAKSQIQRQIATKMLEIIEIKEILYLKPPRGSDKEIKKIYDEYKPLKVRLGELERELNELQSKDEEQQARILAETVAIEERQMQKEEKAELARQTELEKQRIILEEKKVAELKIVEDIKAILVELQSKATILIPLAHSKITSTSNDEIKEIYKSAIISINKAIEIQQQYAIIAEELRLIRAGQIEKSKSEIEKLAKLFKDAKINSNIKLNLAKKAEEIINKNPDDIFRELEENKVKKLQEVKILEAAAAAASTALMASEQKIAREKEQAEKEKLIALTREETNIAPAREEDETRLLAKLAERERKDKLRKEEEKRLANELRIAEEKRLKAEEKEKKTRERAETEIMKAEKRKVKNITELSKELLELQKQKRDTETSITLIDKKPLKEKKKFEKERERLVELLDVVNKLIIKKKTTLESLRNPVVEQVVLSNNDEEMTEEEFAAI